MRWGNDGPQPHLTTQPWSLCPHWLCLSPHQSGWSLGILAHSHTGWMYSSSRHWLYWVPDLGKEK